MSKSKGYTITPVRTPEALKHSITLFTAYTEWLNIDLAFQDFASEMAQMPGKYAPPKGELLLALNDHTGEALGCVAMRPLLSSPGCCEMKRLYVAPQGRGLGLGKALVAAILEAAKQAGYEEILLDTLPNMTQAVALYKHLGFVETAKYYETPLENTMFLSKRL